MSEPELIRIGERLDVANRYKGWLRLKERRRCL